MQGGLHGDEPGSSEGLFYLMEQLMEKKEYAHLLDKIVLAIVPMANIDGYEKQKRLAANGLDLNRDQTKLMAPETVVLKKAYHAFLPDVAVDFHEYRPYRKDFARLSTFGITSIYDVMFLYSGNLNVPENLRQFTESHFVQNARETLKDHGLRYRDYISTRDHLGDIHFSLGSSNARSSATSWALTNTISTLVEVRGVGLGKTSFLRRVQATFLVAMSFLQTSYDQADEVKAILQQAIESKGEAVAKSKPAIYQDSIQAIDLDTNEEITLEVTMQDALKSSATLVRERPVGYIIMDNEEVLIEKLDALGLQMKTLPLDCGLKIESFQIDKYQQDAVKTEGVNRQAVSAGIKEEIRAFSEPGHVLFMDQRYANLAIELLEPEAPNSFVSFEVLKTAMGAELPVYRLMEKNSCITE